MNWNDVLTLRSKGTAVQAVIESTGDNKVTFGSDPRKADRLNLKPPFETKLSVITRSADFCTFARCRPPRSCRSAILGKRLAKICSAALTT